MGFSSVIGKGEAGEENDPRKIVPPAFETLSTLEINDMGKLEPGGCL